MRRRLILHETTSYFIDGRVFFRIFIFFISYSTMIDYRCVNTGKSIPREKLNHCQRPKTWWTWRVTSIIAKNKPHHHHKTHLPAYNESLKSSTSFAPIFPKLTSQNEAFHCGTSRFLSPVSTISARNARDHYPLLTRTQEKKRKKKKRNTFLVSQQTEALLKTPFHCWKLSE